ncbi:MAG: poly-gamma-glutamate hydrolase family protein [Desulfobacterales bacterium]
MKQRMLSVMTYRSFEELSANETEGLDYRIRDRGGASEIAVVAIHGGGIEPGTTEIAEATAGERHAFYTFSGLKSRGNGRLHITSRRFDEPRCLRRARLAHTVISIHGCGDAEPLVLLGGRHNRLGQLIGQSLETAGFVVRRSVRFPGLSPQNICNRGRLRRGVQLEISAGLRSLMFGDLTRSQRKKPSPLLLCFVTAVQAALDTFEKTDRDAKDLQGGAGAQNGTT